MAATDIALSTAPVEADPVYPLAFFTTKAKQGRSPLPQVEAGIKRLRDLKYPVTVKDQGDAGRHLNEEEFTELVRWIDSLDKV